MDNCNVCQGKFEEFGDDSRLKIVKYGDTYYLQHGKEYYDEWLYYDLETKIYFCPICGRKLK